MKVLALSLSAGFASSIGAYDYEHTYEIRVKLTRYKLLGILTNVFPIRSLLLHDSSKLYLL